MGCVSRRRAPRPVLDRGALQSRAGAGPARPLRRGARRAGSVRPRRGRTGGLSPGRGRAARRAARAVRMRRERMRAVRGLRAMRYAPILIALAAAATARADSDRKLHLAVHGSVDSAALGDSIGKELGVDVAVTDGTCDVPCLDVSVDGKRAATVVYAPRAGSTRARTIKLGTNTSQWTVVLTLLAGNIVRDEARAVLAELPERNLPRTPGPAEA